MAKAAEHMDMVNVNMDWKTEDGVTTYYYKCEVELNGKARE